MRSEKTGNFLFEYVFIDKQTDLSTGVPEAKNVTASQTWTLQGLCWLADRKTGYIMKFKVQAVQMCCICATGDKVHRER